MLNLESLRQSQQSVTGEQRQRWQLQYEEALEKAQRFLGEFQQTGMGRRELLQQACLAYTQAMQYNRRSPEPYIGLAYVFIVLDDSATATQLLQEAQQLQPDHPDAQMFLDYLQQLPRLRQQLEKKSAAITHQPMTDEDYDLLYDQTEAKIQVQIQKLSQQRPPQITLDKRMLKEQSQFYQQLQSQLNLFQENLRILDQEMETEELQTRLRPLMVMLQRLSQLLGVSEQMQQVQSQIRQFRQEIEEQLLRLQSNQGSQGLEQWVEQMLDHCDGVADQLDQFETQGHPVQPLMQEYENWIKQVGQLQDLIDERLV